ncbi:DUF6415 family natural product biosynthesis protein (plasmid) [Streptomyces olivoreticuli]|uniref:DUF6415 family natural product biosynthesis protein n=1 Tax=Streptomyces olivoreticuli TaxID=68246 RepID=UPI002658DBB1|nr:DUF6415 family natural product biosynthesis protein [Streptomyces olivoreticuli]WKK27837.1 DUF6415 family natural product biosynthesis protein [Streptomyces olivoreticuli]
MTTTPSRTTAGAHRAVEADETERGAPVDAERIKLTIADALRPVVEGTSMEPEQAAATMQLLVGHVQLLLPIAQARYWALRPRGGLWQGMSAVDFDALERRLDYVRPCPRTHPLNTAVWMGDMARACRQLLALATDTEADR